MNNSSSSSSNSSEPGNNGDGFEANEFTYIVTFVFGLIFLVLTVVVACVRLRMSRSSNNILNILAGFSPHRNAGEDSTMEQGLRHHSDTSFEGYPKLLYSEVQKKGGGDGDSSSLSSSCSICLGDYKESDALRLLPDCGHIYHVACVDPWLRLHATCPICRKSSLQLTPPPHIATS